MNEFQKIDDFKKQELLALKLKFKKSLGANLQVIHFQERDGKYYYQARLENDSRFLVEGISKESPHEAKHALIIALQKEYKKMMCPIRTKKNHNSIVF